MTRLDLGLALRAAHDADPAAIPDVVLGAAGALDATDVVVYLIDFAQTTLEPLPNRSVHADLPHAEDVATSVAGKAYLSMRPTQVQQPAGVRVWVPVVEGSNRTGVLALTVAQATEETIEACTELGLFTGVLLAANARVTDVYNLHRRRRSLSLAASMQWDQLPPLMTRSPQFDVAGLVEPAYEVGGDCFDYAVNGSILDLAIFDAMGHGLASAVLSSLTVGSYRHDRREGRSLEQIHTTLDVVVTGEYSNLSFSTGQLARLNLDTGALTWTNAGHPLPFLIRSGDTIRELACAPTLPWGLGSLQKREPAVTVAAEVLEPGDSVLFYTDGLVEAHGASREPFGLERLVELAGRQALDGVPPEESVRRIVRSLVEHQDSGLTDDATVVVVRWNGPGPAGGSVGGRRAG